jgi:hypothetical protein
MLTRTLTASLLLVACSIQTILPSKADLGEAELARTEKTFDAWCSTKGNPCKVTISDGNSRISVNGGKGVTRDQILLLVVRAIPKTDFWKGIDYEYNYEIKYKDEATGESKDGLIIFANLKAATEFDNYFFRLSRRPVVRVSDYLWSDSPELFTQERGGEIRDMLEAQKVTNDSINTMTNQQQLIQNQIDSNRSQSPRTCTTVNHSVLGITSTSCN